MLNVRYQKDNTVVYPETSFSNHRDVHETTYSDSLKVLLTWPES